MTQVRMLSKHVIPVVASLAILQVMRGDKKPMHPNRNPPAPTLEK